MTDRPSWAKRIRAMRESRGWSQAAAAEEMRRHSENALPDAQHLERRWKAWELGENKPGPHYAPIIAATLGTATASLFPPENKPTTVDLIASSGMDTLEIVSRINISDINSATLDALRITVERLCSEYASSNPNDLIVEGRQWLRRLVELQDRRLTLRASGSRGGRVSVLVETRTCK
ncbi:helix-turn-helix transcriptional regulator [Pseudonocardia sp. ICBG1293]|uniref:helix-turn-helix domain-containing protein n=1 Tax=Pseudonocardia sp. ICBG1293 TaxID=2844382 RepID=UPI001CCA295C|nr:helix-turn-helix transcriptional regulator [Pseudonocardia sp. ICBG1293]